MPDEPSSSLVTTGQLDWVALARTPVSFTLEAMSRIAKAGVEIVTVSVGSAICSSFAFGPEGQKELTDSLNGLQGTGAFSKALWFGFGVKSLASMLSETEQGACCVALCAALSMPYTPYRAAHIWREMTRQVNAPDALTPSIHQWSNLVKTCSGALADSHFPFVFDHFFRLLVPQRGRFREPAPAKALGEALLILARLSKGSMASAVFVGGMDCALLATIAKVLLRLKVEIRDEENSLLFASDTEPAEAIFIRESRETESTALAKLIQRRAYFVSNGREIIDNCGPDDIFHGPTQWSTIFQDAFPSWRMFSNPPLAAAFSILLRDAALRCNEFGTNSTKLMLPGKIGNLKVLHQSSVGFLPESHSMRAAIDFLFHARAMFPELIAITEPPHVLLKTPGTYDESIAQITEACQCDSCHVTRDYDLRHTWLEDIVCLREISSAVLHIIGLVSGLKIHKGVRPNIFGVRARTRHMLINQPRTNPSTLSFCDDTGLFEQILAIFTAEKVSSLITSAPKAAACAQGVCVINSLMMDPNKGPDTLLFEVMPGNIRYNNHYYRFITAKTSLVITDPDNFVGGLEKTQMIVEEIDDPSTLTAFYRLRLQAGVIGDLNIVRARSNVARWLSLDEYRHGELTNLSDTYKVVDVVRTPHSGFDVVQHHWSLVRIFKDGNIEPIQAEILVLRNPLLYYAASVHPSNCKAALLKMCCCSSCVQQLTCAVLQSLPERPDSRTVKWCIVANYELGSGGKDVMMDNFVMTVSAKRSVPITVTAVQPKIGKLSMKRKAIDS